MSVMYFLFGAFCFLSAISNPSFAIDPKTKGEVDFPFFVKAEWPSFVADSPPKDCKEARKKKKSISYEACIVGKRPYFIRMLDEGTPWGVIKFKQGAPVQYEGVENPEIKLLKGGKVVAIFNEEAKTVKTQFLAPDEKEFNKIAESEVSRALSAFGLKP